MKRVAGGMLLVMVSLVAHAQTGKEPWEEAEKRIKASQKVEALGDNLFGDKVSYSNGALSFSVTDISLPGNNALPVALTRTFSVENRAAENLSGRTGYTSDFMFADWDLDIPSISGVFAPDWVVAGTAPLNRCSAGTAPSSQVIATRYIAADDIWHGNTLKLFSGGGELLLAGSGAPKPASGGPYVWVTPDLAYVACLASIKNATGEGFLAVDRDGTKYYFDWLSQYKEPNLKVPTGTGSGYLFLERRRNVLYPSRVEDRFGNYVEYTYSNAYNQPGKLTRIVASDGRQLALAYDASGHVSSVVAGSSTWSYGYAANGGKDTLASVTQPDSSRWTINFSELANTYLAYRPSTADNPERTCIGGSGPIGTTTYTGTLTHPSGATGTFVVEALEHGRSNVPLNCEGFRTPGRQVHAETSYWAFYYYGYSLTRKTISGPGMATNTWAYGYADDISYFYPQGSSYDYPVCVAGQDCGLPKCTSDSCAGVSTTTVVGPGDEWTRFTHGNSYRYNEGKLLKVERGASASAILSTQTSSYDLSLTDKAYLAKWGTSLRGKGDGFQSEYHRPRLSSKVVQDGVTYQSVTNSFDAYARPLSVTRSGPSGSRTDVTAYYDNTAKWILDQVAQVTNGNTGLVETKTAYDGNAMPVQSWSFGKLQQTLTYNTDGTLATVKDGNANTTTLSSWKRGIPQSIKYADGTSESAVVNDNGWITSVSDENGYATAYGYDAMGRLASLTYPGNDSVAWNATTQAFSQVNSAEYGLAAGHWKQVVATGNARKETYFDALWRPIVTREYDTASVAATQRFQRFSYDEQGRQVFASYPGTSDGLSTGAWTDYDALGRVTSSSQDSELGLLTTLTAYLSGGQVRVTDPKGKQTTTRFQAFDQPDTSKPVAIQHPEGAYTDIDRDVFGKPTAITRRNADSTQAVTRSYAYNANQELCRTVEPETGATLMGYDAAGNLKWSAAGLAASIACEANGITSAVAARRVDRGYDTRNRLRTLAFPDGNGNQAWSYTSDGKPAQIVTQNEAGSSQVVNSYSYNKRRLLTGESMQPSDGSAWSLGYAYAANGALAGITYPSGLYVDYAPNALGQPTKAGSYATGVSYYPNGGMKQFTYGNGLGHSLTQNARQLPSRVVDGGGALDNAYSYDGNGNVAKIDDALDANRTRTMAYDGLDRLTQASSPSFLGNGVMRYSYDALDNLRSAKLSGVKEHNYWYDASNRLTNVNADSGATTIGLGYDVQGNLNNKNGQVYTFDYGNRLREANGKESYRYDGYGRRVQASVPGGGRILSFYGQDGVLRRQDNQRTGKNYEYVSLNGSLLARLTTAVVLNAPTLTLPGYSGTGSYTISWSTSNNATRYELQEAVNGGTWTALYSGTALTQAVTGKAPGSYQYRARACQGSACGNWSATATISVVLPPTAAPALTVPANGPNGSYAVSWASVAAATSYVLEENPGTGTWSQAYNGANQTVGFTGKAAGTYSYRVKACNSAGCGPVSATGSVMVIHPPAAAPTLTAPSQSTSSAYTVSWTAVATATSYRLEENANSGGWSQVQDATSTSRAVTGKAYGSYAYRVRACNLAGCGGYSATVTTTVILVPTTAPSISLASSNSSGSYSVSWNGIGGAIEYRLEEQVGGGSWSQIQAEGATTRTLSGKGSSSYGYRVRACNAAGCGPYSSVASIVVLRIPGTPGLTVPATSTSGEYSVSWNGVADATRYVLNRNSAGGAWSQVYSGASTSFAESGRSIGSWGYQVQACNASGCGAWSSTATVAVQASPLATPAGLTVKQQTRALCRVSWSAVGGATYYELMEAGALAQSGNALVYTLDATCQNPYKVRACNANTCSTWSSEVSG